MPFQSVPVTAEDKKLLIAWRADWNKNIWPPKPLGFQRVRSGDALLAGLPEKMKGTYQRPPAALRYYTDGKILLRMTRDFDKIELFTELNQDNLRTRKKTDQNDTDYEIWIFKPLSGVGHFMRPIAVMNDPTLIILTIHSKYVLPPFLFCFI